MQTLLKVPVIFLSLAHSLTLSLSFQPATPPRSPVALWSAPRERDDSVCELRKADKAVRRAAAKGSNRIRLAAILPSSSSLSIYYTRIITYVCRKAQKSFKIYIYIYTSFFRVIIPWSCCRKSSSVFATVKREIH